MTKFNRNKVEGDFLLRITLTDQNQINDFLSRLFSETASFSKRSQNNNLGRSFVTDKLSISYNFVIPGHYFFDANELFLFKIKNTDLNYSSPLRGSCLHLAAKADNFQIC